MKFKGVLFLITVLSVCSCAQVELVAQGYGEEQYQPVLDQQIEEGEQ